MMKIILVNSYCSLLENENILELKPLGAVSFLSLLCFGGFCFLKYLYLIRICQTTPFLNCGVNKTLSKTVNFCRNLYNGCNVFIKNKNLHSFQFHR